MKARTKIHRVLLAVVAISMLAIIGGTPALAKPASSGGTAAAAYNAIPSKVPGNVPSQGFECCQTNEFGDEVALGGTARTIQSMSVVLSSWGCESGHHTAGDCSTTPGLTFPVEMTFKVYADNAGTPGALLAQTIQTVNVLYRPSASANCTGGRWYNTKDHTCYNGFVQTVKVPMSGLPLTDQVIWSVAYNTSTSGYVPKGVTTECYTTDGGCGYDSLNVGTFSAPNAPYAGTDIDEDEAFRNGVMEPGWTTWRPLGMIVTTK